MRLLTLIRHGKSSWDFDGLPDDERPLNRRGRKDVPNMALRFVGQGHRPDYLLSSYATRALTTARLFARQLHYPVERIRLSEAMYECSVDDLYRIVGHLNNQHWHVCLFGHNPGFTLFANELCHEAIENIPTAGIAHIRLNIETWDKVTPGCAELASFDYPKKPSAKYEKRSAK